MQNKKSLGYIFLAFVAGMLLMYLFTHYKIEEKSISENTEVSYQKSENQNYSYEKSSKKSEEFEKKREENFDENSIENLTNETVVINYIKSNHKLPDYYITKSEAKSFGWVPSKGNLCEVAPRRAIGGDIWTNRQKSLPTKSGRRYFEADLNYNCGNRNADRVVFSNDGLVFVTHDHYRNFEEK